jgi:pyridoxal biosynthesis lyase PdxS
MKTIPIPVKPLTRVKHAYDALMLDDLPIDFDKVSELIQAAGEVVRVAELRQSTTNKPAR